MNIMEYYQSKIGLAEKYLPMLNLDLGIAKVLRLGFFDRSYCNEFFEKPYTVKGKEQRAELQKTGFLNEKSSEIFRGAIVFPFYNINSELVNAYGFRTGGGVNHKKSHFYMHGQKGIFNLDIIHHSKNIIIGESVVKALEFIVKGHENVLAIYEFASEYIDLFKTYSVHTVYLTQRHSELVETFRHNGIEAFLIGEDDSIEEAQSYGKKPENEIEENAKFDIDDVKYVFDDRTYRVRGMPSCSVYGALKVNLMVLKGDEYHADVFDLYISRHRKKFIKDSCEELLEDEGLIKKDIGKILFNLEELQDKLIRDTLKPVEEIVISHEEREEAIDYLRDPDLIENIANDFIKAGLIGEETNSIVGYLCSITRFFKKPISIIVQSQSSGGKSTVMDAISDFIPDEHRYRVAKLTSQSLYYFEKDSLKHKTLVLSEDEASTSSNYELKILLSEQKLSIASTGKDKHGKLVTESYEVSGPLQLMLSTTTDVISEELQNRCLILSVKSDEKHTQQIQKLQRQQRTLKGLLTKGDNREAIIIKHKNMQRLFDTKIRVVIPFAEKLKFTSIKLRNRRDQLKYLTVLEAVAFVHQFQREVKTFETIRYIEATIKDLEITNRLMGDVLEQSVSELAPQTALFLGKLVELKEKSVRFTRKDIRSFTHWSSTQIHIHLKRLIDLEYVLCFRASKGRFQEYELISDPHHRTSIGLAIV